jgi:AcrR family transcriptional regulator
MAEKKLDTEVRREQIAEAALGLVATQGLRRLSVAAVARRVGLVPSGIYRHFKNKDEILDAVLDRVEQRLLANVKASRDEHADALDCLKDVLMRHIRFLREGKVISIPRMIFADDAHGDNPQRRRRVLRVFERYTGEVAEIVRLGQSQGRIRREADAQTVATMLFGIIVPAGILWHLTDGGFDVTRHAQRAWKLFAAAVAQPAEYPGSHRRES